MLKRKIEKLCFNGIIQPVFLKPFDVLNEHEYPESSRKNYYV